MSRHAVFLRIYHQLQAGELSLPALPDIALRVREAVQDSNQTLAGIARIVQLEPPLAAYLVSVANSPLVRAARPVDSCQAAVSRLGLTTTGNLVMSYSLRSLFTGGSPSLQRLLRAEWQASVQLGALASVLAGAVVVPGRRFDADRALLAGLLQDIGALPVLARLAELPAVLADDTLVTAILDEYRVPVGRLLLKHWRFDEEMLEVVSSRLQWLRDPAPSADLADLVLLARLHALAGTPAFRNCPRIDQLPAWRKLGAGALTADASLAVLHEAKAQVLALQKLMAG